MGLSVERVVEHYYQSLSHSMPAKDWVPLKMALREHSVTGTILLLDIDAEVLNGFGLKTFGARAPIRRDIENLRLRGHKYHDYARATSDEDSRVAHTAKRRRPLSPPCRTEPDAAPEFRAEIFQPL
jgi:hypothetical protein